MHINFNKRGGRQGFTARQLFLITLLTVASALAFPSRVRAQQGQPGEESRQLREDVQSLKEGMAVVQRELLEIKKLLLSKQPAAAAPSEPPRELTLDVGGAPSKGDNGAKLVLVEYSDYQCPFCSRYVRDTLPMIERDYIKTGKIKYVFRDFPLESIHPNAMVASEAAACANEQGKYWEMRDRLFGNQTMLAAADMPAHAKAIGIEAASFQQCLAGGKHKESIRKSMAEALSLGVTGTPTFFIGTISPSDSKVKVIRALRGAAPYANFKEVLDGLLASGK